VKAADRPRAAPWRFPYGDHRTCAEVRAAECPSCGELRTRRCSFTRCPIEAR